MFSHRHTLDIISISEPSLLTDSSWWGSCSNGLKIVIAHCITISALCYSCHNECVLILPALVNWSILIGIQFSWHMSTMAHSRQSTHNCVFRSSLPYANIACSSVSDKIFRMETYECRHCFECECAVVEQTARKELHFWKRSSIFEHLVWGPGEQDILDAWDRGHISRPLFLLRPEALGDSHRTFAPFESPDFKRNFELKLRRKIWM